MLTIFRVMALKALKDNHKDFAKLVAAKVHPTEAAVQAGFSAKTAKFKAIALMKEPLIIEFIEECSHEPFHEIMKKERKEITDHTKELIKNAQNRDRFGQYDLTQNRVINEAYVIATLDPAMIFDDKGQMMHVRDMPEEIRHAISDVKITTRTDSNGRTYTETQVKFHSKMAAIETVIKNTDKEKKQIRKRTPEERQAELDAILNKTKRFNQ